MALQFRRGLDADRTSITPLPGEPLWITDTDELYVGDGSTAGGVLITGGGGGGAPTNVDYLVKTANGTLTAERVVTDSTSVTANWGTSGQVAFERAALTGDVTASANGNTTTIANDAVTFAKMQNIATDKLLGRATAGSGDVEEITCTSAGRALLDDADAAAQRTTLGLGTIATQAASSVTITGGSLEGVTVTTNGYSSKVNEAIMHAVRKASAGTITKGEVVRITGSSGTHLEVELADASAEATSTGTIGIAATSITTTAGYMMVAGELTGLSNVPTASFTNGAALWLSETTGGFTTTRPTQPAHGVFLGWVVEASNGSAGRIYVKVINGQELNELHDVLINTGTLADNHFLVYDNATSLWKNESPCDARTSLGLGTVATESTVPINKGGTGQTTATAAFDALAPTTTKGDIIVFDGTDNVRLAVGGTNDHVLTVDSSTATGLKWAAATVSSGGTKTYAVFTPLQAQPPASNFATLDTRVDIAVLEFDATTEKSTTFVGIMPEGASLGSGLKVRIHWMSLDQTSNSVVWGVQFQELIDDVDTATYDTEQTGTTATSGSGAGTVNVTEITVTTIDSISAGDAFRLKVARKAADGSDNMSNDAQVIAVEVRSAA